MAGIRETLRTELLQDREYAQGYAESFLDSYIATQLKVLREDRELTQQQLAELLGTKQTVVSRFESVNYSAWNIGTLKKIARAYDVRLHVSFETYGSLLDEVETFSRKALQRLPREKDPALRPEQPKAALASNRPLAPGINKAILPFDLISSQLVDALAPTREAMKQLAAVAAGVGESLRQIQESMKNIAIPDFYALVGAMTAPGAIKTSILTSHSPIGEEKEANKVLPTRKPPTGETAFRFPSAESVSVVGEKRVSL